MQTCAIEVAPPNPIRHDVSPQSERSPPPSWKYPTQPLERHYARHQLPHPKTNAATPLLAAAQCHPRNSLADRMLCNHRPAPSNPQMSQIPPTIPYQLAVQSVSGLQMMSSTQPALLLEDHAAASTGPNQTRSDETRPVQTGPSDQTRPDRSKCRPDQTKTKLDQTKPDQTKPDQTRVQSTTPEQFTPHSPFPIPLHLCLPIIPPHHHPRVLTIHLLNPVAYRAPSRLLPRHRLNNQRRELPAVAAARVEAVGVAVAFFLLLFLFFVFLFVGFGLAVEWGWGRRVRGDVGFGVDLQAGFGVVAVDGEGGVPGVRGEVVLVAVPKGGGGVC